MKLLNEILGTKYPIIQGGMANIATGEFAAACSNAGALGLIGAGGMNPETLRENIRQCRRLTDKPFGVNIMLMHPQADEFAQIVIDEGVKIVTTGAGNPGKYMAAWKAAGITVIPVVAAAVLAKHLAPLGIDAVIAEGTESGGHVGEMTTMALVPQVVDAVDLPVIAAGGIADGRGLAAALALGACGVQVGTCLLTSTECPIHENYKDALLKARDSDTIVTGRLGGTPVRVLKNRMSREYVRQEKAGADKAALEQFTLGSLRKAVSTPLVCYSIAEARTAGVKIPLYGGGGVFNYENAARILMAGSEMVQLGALACAGGTMAGTKLISDLNRWMDENGYADMDSLVGDSLKLFQMDADFTKKRQNMLADAYQTADADRAKCIGCGRCEDVCWHQGIEIKDRKAYKTDKCIGCGYCFQVCPTQALYVDKKGILRAAFEEAGIERGNK